MEMHQTTWVLSASQQCNWADLKAAAPGHSCLQGPAKGWVATPTFAPRVREMEPAVGGSFPGETAFSSKLQKATRIHPPAKPELDSEK